MVIGALILAIGQIGIFGVPYFESETSILIWVASFFALSTLGFTMVAIPYGATAGEITYESQKSDPHLWDLGWRLLAWVF